MTKHSDYRDSESYRAMIDQISSQNAQNVPTHVGITHTYADGSGCMMMGPRVKVQRHYGRTALRAALTPFLAFVALLVLAVMTLVGWPVLRTLEFATGDPITRGIANEMVGFWAHAVSEIVTGHFWAEV